MSTPPRHEIVLVSLASSTALATAFAPLGPWLAPDAYPLAVALSAAWAVWRWMACDRSRAQRRAWEHNTTWTLAPEDLACETMSAWRATWARHRRRS